MKPIRDNLVQTNDLGWFLFCSVRYSLGRVSYAPDLTADLVRKYRAALTEEQAKQIASEIREHLRLDGDRGYTGFRDIAETWRTLAEELEGA